MANAPKIKVFSMVSMSPTEEFEDRVNEWLEDNNSSIRIIDVMTSGSRRNGLVVTIVYKDREDKSDEDAPKYGLN